MTVRLRALPAAGGAALAVLATVVTAAAQPSEPPPPPALPPDAGVPAASPVAPPTTEPAPPTSEPTAPASTPTAPPATEAPPPPAPAPPVIRRLTLATARVPASVYPSRLATDEVTAPRGGYGMLKVTGSADYLTKMGPAFMANVGVFRAFELGIGVAWPKDPSNRMAPSEMAFATSMTFLALSYNAVELSTGVMRAGSTGSPLVRLSLPLFARWLPFKINGRVRISYPLGVGIEWGNL